MGRLSAPPPLFAPRRLRCTPKRRGPSRLRTAASTSTWTSARTFGIQVRKLFEPELFPDAAGDSIAVFNRFFGSAAERRKSTCAIGLEMNPTHTSRLKALEAAYAQQGWRTRFFTQTAVGVDFSTGHYDHTGMKDTPLD